MKRAKHILSYSIPILVLLFFLFGSFFAPNDPTATNIRDKFLSSSTEYPFGTDNFGRCEFSRKDHPGNRSHWVSHCNHTRRLFRYSVGKNRTAPEHPCGKYFERGYSNSSCGLPDYLHRDLGEQHPHNAGSLDRLIDSSDDKAGQDLD